MNSLLSWSEIFVDVLVILHYMQWPGIPFYPFQQPPHVRHKWSSLYFTYISPSITFRDRFGWWSLISWHTTNYYSVSSFFVLHFSEVFDLALGVSWILHHYLHPSYLQTIVFQHVGVTSADYSFMHFVGVTWLTNSCDIACLTLMGAILFVKRF